MSEVMARLATKIEPDDAGCWLWTAAQNGHGYGVVRINGTLCVAHRVVYELLIGPIPPGLDLDHLCRVRHGVNPAHLEPVTRAENLGRSPLTHANKTHCPKGHPLLAPNLCGGMPSRKCKTCKNAAERERQRRLRDGV